MASRLVLVLGDLFIPDRAPVRDHPSPFPVLANTGRLIGVPGYTTKSRAPNPLPIQPPPLCPSSFGSDRTQKLMTRPPTVQETLDPRQNRPDPMSGEPDG